MIAKEVGLFSSNVARGSPGELNLVAVNIGALGLCVDALDDVAVCEFPAASSLGLVESEVALEEGTVGVEPFTFHELAVLEGANVFLARLLEDVGALAVLLASDPVARVDIFVDVGHDALAAALTILPVTVVLAHTSIFLLADAMLLVVNPGTLVGNLLLFGALGTIGVFTLAFAFATNEVARVSVAVRVVSCALASVVAGSGVGVALSINKRVLAFFCHRCLFL
eukprot:CAMPEP_0170466672 /NCGR_PEP_ID=MMETSP0123-20130129/10541_1 /TAXON_ID=182087 /ORGANISM="Favella ehrenbergii, Strain Fehren 1" /LENGTH=224 /DNA_ID=CAMNT_0010732853 /DNA_START=58 /DNA_END=730 /DNA_ORIENTATION=-